MKNILYFLSIFMLFSSLSFGQSKVSNADLSKEWKLITSDQGVEFYVRKDECPAYGNKLPFEHTFLRIVNTTNTSKSVSFNFTHFFTEGCAGCEANSEQSYTYTLEANSIKEGSCEAKRGLSGLVNNPNFSGGWHFEAVEIRYLKIN